MTSLPPRREFLASTLIAGAAAAVGVSTLAQRAEAAPQTGAKRQYYELWLYQMTAGAMVQRADDYFGSSG